MTAGDRVIISRQHLLFESAGSVLNYTITRQPKSGIYSSGCLNNIVDYPVGHLAIFKVKFAYRTLYEFVRLFHQKLSAKLIHTKNQSCTVIKNPIGNWVLSSADESWRITKTRCIGSPQ